MNIPHLDFFMKANQMIIDAMDDTKLTEAEKLDEMRYDTINPK